MTRHSVFVHSSVLALLVSAISCSDDEAATNPSAEAGTDAGTGGRATGGRANTGGSSARTGTGGSNTGGASGGAGTGGSNSGGTSGTAGSGGSNAGGSSTGGASVDGGGGDGQAGTEAGTGPDATPDGGDTVTGTDILHFVTETGITDVPVDLSTWTIEALVESGTSFTTYPGSGKSDGTFSIPNVPQGEFTIHIGGPGRKAYYVTSARHIDLGSNSAGRTDAAVAGAGTTLTFDVTGLDPWDDAADDLQIYSANAGMWLSGLQFGASAGAPATSDTALTGMVYDYAGAPLVKSTSGDQLILTQLAPKPREAGAPYLAVVKALSTSIDMTDGQNTSVSGAMAPVAQSNTLATTWKHGDFTSLTSAVNPSANLVAQVFLIDVLTGPLTNGEEPNGPGMPDLLIYENDGATTDEAVSFTYGNPYPAADGLIGITRGIYITPLSLPLPDGGMAAPYLAFNGIDHDDAVAAFASGPIAPLVSPPQAPKVNGQDAFSDVSGVGAGLTLSWTAPAVGTATSYFIEVRELAVNAGETRTVPGTRFRVHLKGTSFHFPPGALEAGKHYTLTLHSVTGAMNVETDPNLIPLPAASGGATLGIVSP